MFSRVACALLLCGLLASEVLASPSHGRRGFTIEPRIIEGFDVQGIDNTPFLVSLSLSGLVYSHSCAGVIIFKEWVLTVAHCVEQLKQHNGDINHTPVYAGLRDRANLTNAQVRFVDFAAVHRQFTGKAGTDNIALLHVSEPFEYSARVQQISLPAFNEDYSDKLAISYGWGLTDAESDKFSKELQYSFAKVENRTVCAAQLPEEAPLSDGQVCAAIKACHGDGGSPLVYWPIYGPPELVGITSWAYMPCGYEHRPTVYTRVSKYNDWIFQVLSAYYLLG